MTRRDRILFLNHVSQISGAEKGLLDIVRHLDTAKYEALTAIPLPGPLGDEFAAAGAEVIPLPMRRFQRTLNPLRLLGYAFNAASVSIRLMKWLRSRNIRLVHCNSSAALLYAGLACRLSGVPCIWHCRDLSDRGLTARAMGRFASCVVAISDTVARSVRPYVPHGTRLVTCHNGIDTDFFFPRPATTTLRSELGIDSSAPLVFNIGQLVPWKRQDAFLEVASKIAAQLPEAHFVVVGTDMFNQHAEYVARLHELCKASSIASRVHMVGYRTDVADMLSDADLLLHMAEREPFGRAIAEAMSMGVPVVAPDSCGPAELIRDGIDGLLYAAGDLGVAADLALRVLTDNDLAHRLGKGAQKRIEDTFALDRYTARLDELYQSLLHHENGERVST